MRPWSSRVTLALLTALAAVAGAQAPAPALNVGGLYILRGPLPPPAPGDLDGPASPACPRPDAPLDRVLYDHLQGQGAALSCGNHFEDLIAFPGTASPWGAYENLAAQVRAARREVLLANMVWDGGPTAPGALIAAALADLRRNVSQHPERYPQGMTVRVLLGNSIRFDSLLDPTTSAFNAAGHLLQAGIPLTEPAGSPWTLEVANYRYAFPHSHMKLLVIDAQDVTTGGFNISTLHQPKSAPGGLGLSDLALHVRGPVARHAAAAFHDAWTHSQHLSCPPTVTPATLRATCTLNTPAPPYTLNSPTPATPAGEARVYPLYRRPGAQASDDAYAALLGAARDHIDLLQSQVSGDLTCDLSLLAPGGCPAPHHLLPVWQGVLSAIRDRHVHVRLVLDRAPVLQVEALQLLGGLRAALHPLGLNDLLDARWSTDPGGVHTKAALVDGEMAVVGSHNLHFSSFGPQGLSEYSLATSDPATLQAVQAIFDDEWQRAVPVTLPWWLNPGLVASPHAQPQQAGP